MNGDVQKKLQELFVEYSKNLPDKINNVELQWQKLCIHFDREKFKTFHRDVHSLCGSAPTYGFIEVGVAARQLEIYLKSLLSSASLDKEQQEKINHLLSGLKQAQLKPAPAKLPILATLGITEKADKIVYIIEKDKEVVNELSASMKDAGYELRVIDNILSLPMVIKDKTPVAIIVDTDYLDVGHSELLRDLAQQEAAIPLFCIVPPSDLISRLKAIRSGSKAFFQKPIDVFYLTKIVDQMCDTSSENPYRILIIDDSESLAEYYALVLNEAGMTTRVITKPLQLLQALEEFQPDLLLMDIYMPECTGLELAAVLRQEALYTKIPIIFLSTEDNKLKQQSALSLGGDDFLAKPILPQHLVSAVKARAKRAGILNFYMNTDSLTGLLNHSSILNRLGIELVHAAQEKRSLSFIMIDIDHFKEVNDTYGHPVGDFILKKLSALLLSRLRKQDVVGRYGGEEFAVILADSDLEDSKVIVDNLREQFAAMPFTANGVEFHVSFSAGISSYPHEKTAYQLIEAADQALYKAKHHGRNQVVVMNP